MAINPAKTPGPMIATNNKAQISELIERDETIIKRAKFRIIYLSGVVFLAAKNAIGMAIIVASTVPKVAMFNVSHKGTHKTRHIAPFGRKGPASNISCNFGSIPEKIPIRFRRNPLPAIHKDCCSNQPHDPICNLLFCVPASPNFCTISCLFYSHYCNFPLIKVDVFSSTITMAIIIIMIAAAVSNS